MLCNILQVIDFSPTQISRSLPYRTCNGTSMRTAAIGLLPFNLVGIRTVFIMEVSRHQSRQHCSVHIDGLVMF